MYWIVRVDRQHHAVPGRGRLEQVRRGHLAAERVASDDRLARHAGQVRVEGALDALEPAVDALEADARARPARGWDRAGATPGGSRAPARGAPSPASAIVGGKLAAEPHEGPGARQRGVQLALGHAEDRRQARGDAHRVADARAAGRTATRSRLDVASGAPRRSTMGPRCAWSTTVREYWRSASAVSSPWRRSAASRDDPMRPPNARARTAARTRTARRGRARVLSPERAAPRHRASDAALRRAAARPVPAGHVLLRQPDLLARGHHQAELPRPRLDAARRPQRRHLDLELADPVSRCVPRSLRRRVEPVREVHLLRRARRRRRGRRPPAAAEAARSHRRESARTRGILFAMQPLVVLH